MQHFRWLIRAQLLSAAGDALIAISLAGSLFFTLDPSAARSRVALYLVFTMAPFAIIAPLIGPLIDRRAGGKRLIIIGTAAGRALLALVMIRDLDSLLLFPEAFAALVLGKTYHVAKTAAVPGLVRREEELVEANSKLVLVSGIGGALVILPGVLLSLLSSRWVLVLAVLVFSVMVVPAARVRFQASTFAAPSQDGSKQRKVTAQVLLGGSATSVLRLLNGFTLLFVAFWLRFNDAHTAWFGVMVLLGGVGAALGAVLAPRLRNQVSEANLIAASLVLTSLTGLGATFATSSDTVQRLAVAGLVGVIGLTASTSKLSFDAIAQQDVPPENQGRMFARYETRFQISWVLGAFLPVVIPTTVLTLRASLLTVAVVAASGMVLFVLGRIAVTRGQRTPGERLSGWMSSKYRDYRQRRKSKPIESQPPPQPSEPTER